MSSELHRIGDQTVPPMSLGTMFFGTAVDRATAFACLDAAVAIGAVWWDTANNYTTTAGGTGDESEETLGEWFATRGPEVRDRVGLATKAGARRKADGEFAGLSAGAIREQVTGSLRRLRTDRVDLLYAHVDDTSVPFAETLGAFAELVDEGLVRTVGASNLTAPRLGEALAAEAPVGYRVLQQRFTYLTPESGADFGVQVVRDAATEQLAADHSMTLLGYSPLLSGAYVRADKPIPEAYAGPRADAALAELRRHAAEHDLDAGQLVLAWMVNRPTPVLPVVGASRPEQVEAAWEAVHTTLPPETVDALEAARSA